MSKDISSERFIELKTTQNEGNENEFGDEPHAIHFPPPRTPLNAITDPSQYQREFEELNSESKAKLGSSSRANPRIFATPRVYGRGKTQSELNSAQSTLARSVSKVLNVGATSCAFDGAKPSQHPEARGGSVSSVARGILLMSSQQTVEIPHFELVDDPSFWSDHNVQVLIRIRPLSSTEMVSQGCGQCLRQESAQTLVWLGHPEARLTFDHIADKIISQEKLFRVVGLPMVDNCMSGYNSCMFAYGQTGSGKTYTMMGEICQMDGKLNKDCGITPRIFEYLFTRITEEEEGRRDERLKYSCKCSFLEIYNEQITDLLELSSSNLQLREDLKKGVYVENLTEHIVGTVTDVLKLLLQGAASRKMAATYMNNESSRSHSVFTCTIESHWEEDSTTHIRFGRLNLVDLAGSERQKSSGAEGDRLKEAVNINKSLSTLGLVIMSLVDVAHGKHRHVPYRDSRLTFLLQDSLSGNSKTTIIANVSPSICSANETLSTLKFAQRAKLIQNNAKVNEDASGNVTALQRQIQQLQGQLSFLVEHYNISRPVSNFVPKFQQSNLGDSFEKHDLSGGINIYDERNTRKFGNMKTVCLESTLVGALRREKVAETAARRLDVEIEQMNHLVKQKDEDAQHAKMILRFREEKIKRLDLFADGLVSADKCLMEENTTLKEEIQLLRERIDKNPELTQFALENIRLLSQIRLFQEFYEQGEREKLLSEISELRDQLLESLEGNYGKHKFLYGTVQDNDAIKELEDCKNTNSRLMREVVGLRAELRKYCQQAAVDFFVKSPEEFKQTYKGSSVETVSTRSDSGDEIASCNQQENEVLHNKNGKKIGDALVTQSSCHQKELLHARSLIETMQSEQVRLIKELQCMQEENCRYREILSNKDLVDRESVLKPENFCKERDLENQKEAFAMGRSNCTLSLQAKLDRMVKELEEVRLLNCQYQEDQVSQLSWKQQTELVSEQMEMKTAKTILHLQEEVAALQSELEERLCYTAEENMRLRDTVAAKEDEIREVCMEWERATLELTSFLIEGSKSLRDVSGQIESIACLFPHVNVCLGEHVERAAKVCVEKDVTILVLQKNLEDARMVVLEMEQKLNSLKGAAVALTEVQQQSDNASIKEAMQLTMPLNSEVNMIHMFENKLTYKDDQLIEAENSADAVFPGEKSLSDRAEVSLTHTTEQDISMSKTAISSGIGSQQISEMKAHENALALEDIKGQFELRLALLESTNIIYTCWTDIEMYISALQSEIHEASSLYSELVQGFVKNIHEMRKSFVELKENFRLQTVKISPIEEQKIPEKENQYFLLKQIRDELAETNGRLNTITACIYKLWSTNYCSVRGKDLVEVDTWSAVCSTSDTDPSAESVVPERSLDGSSSTCSNGNLEEINEQALEIVLEGDSTLSSDGRELEKSSGLAKCSIHEKSTKLHLREELKKANDSFNEVNVRLAALFHEKEIIDWSHTGVCFRESPGFMNGNGHHTCNRGLNQHKTVESSPETQAFELVMREAEAGYYNVRELITNEKISQASSFFTKFEEALATMKEADVMLNALLKANKNAKELTGVWKQAGEELMMEKESLINEIEQLKVLLRLKDGENEMLQDQIHCNLHEVENSVSLLEESFLCMQRDVEEMFKVIYSDSLTMAKYILHYFCNSRSPAKDICSETMEQGFAPLGLYKYHVGELPCRSLSPSGDLGFHVARNQERCLVVNKSVSEHDTVLNGVKVGKEGDQSALSRKSEGRESAPAGDDLVDENFLLKRELERKEVVLKGLLFDFSMLQESASTMKDMKDESQKLIVVLSQVQQELQMKTNQLNDVLVQHTKLEDRLADAVTDLFVADSDLEQAKGTIDILSNQIAELKILLKDLYLGKSEVEVQLEEQREVVKSLEQEILRINSSLEMKLVSSIKYMEDDLKSITVGRDHLREQVGSLQDRLEMAYSLVDENEAIAVEARQESEACKVYAEQKEEEVKILERSVQELEFTVNVLEEKVNEMEEEVQKHKLIRDSLEFELQALKERILTVENFKEIMGSDNSNVEQQSEDQLSRKLHNRSMELHEAVKRIRLLEEQRAEQSKEMEQLKEYISELVLHAEAQASQYQHKYKTLEDMVREVKSVESTLTSVALTSDKSEKSSMRPRGSGSPFRCISSLVQQMNVEKDQELSLARLRVEELEALAATRQKEVCMLNTRLAATESMTHDVIRHLLGVKLDMTNYANLIDQYQLQNLVEDTHQRAQESIAMEQEILDLRRRINNLVEDRERYILEVNRRQEDVLAAEITVEQLQERDQLLTAQNEMLKADNSNLKRRIVELDETVKKLFGTQNVPLQIQQQRKNKENNLLKQQGSTDLSSQLAKSEKIISRVNDELAQYRKSERQRHI